MLYSFSTLAQVELKNTQDVYLIGKSVSYLKIPTDSLSFADILSQNPKFTLSTQDELNFGYTDDMVWIKFTVNNQSDFEDWILDLDVNTLDYLDFYFQEEGKWKKVQTGRLFPFESKQIKSTGLAFFLKTAAKSQQTFYLTAKANVGLIIPLRIQRYEHFNEYTRLKNLYYGGYFGILLVMIFYNFFIFLSLRDRGYLYYVFTIITTLALFSSITGYNFMFFWTDFPKFNILFTRLSISLITISTAIFTIHFLQLKKHSRFLYYWMLLNISLAILFIILEQFFSWKTLTNNLISIHIITLIASGIVTWRKGNSLGKYYFFAWLFYVLGGAMLTLRSSGLLPSNIFTRHAVEVGSVFEVVIISFALSAKYSILKKENEEAIKKALAIEKKANAELENKVHERTAELQTTLEIVSKQNENIHASINYASRIQEAFLAIDIETKSALPEHFIFFKPRDVVSGDFYFFAKKDNKIIIAAVDCTGHGIPGAMMSMIGEAYLSQIIHSLETLSTNKILSELHQKIRDALLQDDITHYAVQDGMDIAICIIDNDTKILEFAGAKNPLIYIQNNEIHHIKGSRLTIGGRRGKKSLDNFEKHTITIKSEMSIYLFTDGFQDQFGGEEDKKFMLKNLKELLFENHHKSLEEQKQILENTFEDWKGETRQIDDVLIVGFNIDESF